MLYPLPKNMPVGCWFLFVQLSSKEDVSTLFFVLVDWLFVAGSRSIQRLERASDIYFHVYTCLAAMKSVMRFLHLCFPLFVEVLLPLLEDTITMYNTLGLRDLFVKESH